MRKHLAIHYVASDVYGEVTGISYRREVDQEQIPGELPNRTMPYYYYYYYYEHFGRLI